MKDKVSINEAARLTGRSPHTIRKWIKSGKIAAEKANQTWFIPAKALAGYVDREGLTQNKMFHQLADTTTKLTDELRETRTALVRYQERETSLRDELETLLKEKTGWVREKTFMESEMARLRDRESRRKERIKQFFGPLFPLFSWMIE